MCKGLKHSPILIGNRLASQANKTPPGRRTILGAVLVSFGQVRLERGLERRYKNSQLGEGAMSLA